MVSPGGNVEAFVLAGGRSSRMGQDKALLRLDGRPLVALALEKLRSLDVPPPRIAGARADLSAYAPVLPDLHADCGPLSGIEAALAASSHPLNVFLPVDMPLLPAGFLAWMLQRAEITGASFTVPRLHGRPQPLCAVYHRDLLGAITTALVAGDHKVMRVALAAAPESVDVFDVERVTASYPRIMGLSPLPLHWWFHNCNTQDDLAAMRNALVLSQ